MLVLSLNKWQRERNYRMKRTNLRTYVQLPTSLKSNLPEKVATRNVYLTMSSKNKITKGAMFGCTNSAARTKRYVQVGRWKNLLLLLLAFMVFLNITIKKKLERTENGQNIKKRNKYAPKKHTKKSVNFPATLFTTLNDRSFILPFSFVVLWVDYNHTTKLWKIQIVNSHFKMILRLFCFSGFFFQDLLSYFFYSSRVASIGISVS